MRSPKPIDASTFLLPAVRRMLRPLARLLLHFGITYPTFAELTKRVYVEAAERDFALSDRSQTVSRLSLLTGIHRQDINRLREAIEAREPDAPDSNTALSPRLIRRWTSHPDFLSRGKPAVLYRTRAQGQPSFEDLVESASKDIRPRAVLDEWLRIGVVTERDDGRLALNMDAFVPKDALPQKTEIVGGIIRDHLSASVHNLTGTAPPFFDRSFQFAGLSDAAMAELSAAASEAAGRYLQGLNELAVRLADDGLPDTSNRIAVGVFVFHERNTDE